MSYSPIDALSDLMEKLRKLGFSLRSTPKSPAFDGRQQQLGLPDGRVRFYEHNDLEEPVLDSVDWLIAEYQRLSRLTQELAQALEAPAPNRLLLREKIALRDLRERRFIAQERDEQVRAQRLNMFQAAFAEHDPLIHEITGLRDTYVLQIPNAQVVGQGNVLTGQALLPGQDPILFSVEFAEGTPEITRVQATQSGVELQPADAPSQQAPSDR